MIWDIIATIVIGVWIGSTIYDDSGLDVKTIGIGVALFIIWRVWS